MNERKIGVVIVVLGIGVGLHLLTRGLSGELRHLFPHTSRETPPEEVVPLPLALPPPEVSIVVKRSGEAALQKSTQRPLPRVAQRLLRSTPIPSLPLARAGSSGDLFRTPLELEPAVDFWTKIYGVYTTNQVILHDTDSLQTQYGVLDFTALNESSLSDNEKKNRRDEKIAQEIRHLKATLTDPEAANRIRTQTGLKNRFQEGLKRSGRYMPFFEQIFAGLGVPREISRLVFVESLFNERSLSKVGAAGLWQFMPSTGRLFMNVNSLVDERYDPIVSSYAAARLLLKNYKLLGNWPLAINAYNSGPGNLLKASQKLGTRDIGTIVTQYKTGSYSFASRNFYPSFLAALHVYENYGRYFEGIEMEPLMAFDLIELPATMSLSEIVFLTDSSAQDLKELNPSFAPAVFSGNYYLPAGSQIRLPRDRQGLFASRFIDFYSGPGIPSTDLQGTETALTISAQDPTALE